MKLIKRELVCKDHPKYQGKRSPRSECWACCVMYFLAQDGKVIFTDSSVLVAR